MGTPTCFPLNGHPRSFHFLKVPVNRLEQIDMAGASLGCSLKGAAAGSPDVRSLPFTRKHQITLQVLMRITSQPSPPPPPPPLPSPALADLFSPEPAPHPHLYLYQCCQEGRGLCPHPSSDWYTNLPQTFMVPGLGSSPELVLTRCVALGKSLPSLSPQTDSHL